ncbi:MAG: AraC family transcriptional regulator [Hyphomicrobiaceae bacterium]
MSAERVFDDALSDLRVTGSVLLHDVYASPWAVRVPDEATLKRFLKPPAGTLIFPFHLVRNGGFDLHHSARPVEHIAAGHVAICPSGLEHEMRRGRSARVTPLTELLSSPPIRKCTAQRHATELICGVFELRATPLNPLLGALPPVLSVRVNGESIRPTLIRAAELLALEVESGRRDSFVAARLLEIFFAEALRDHASRSSAGLPGWFRGLNDHRIGSALAAVHRDPGASWTVAALAATVAMSPSRFAARFRETMGQSVLGYVTSWRMTVACRLLRDTNEGISEIASKVGYGDLAAFGRSFKARVGQAPAAWRRSRAMGVA